jgi:hypothetical protein
LADDPTHTTRRERQVSDCIAQFAGIEQDIERIVLDRIAMHERIELL